MDAFLIIMLAGICTLLPFWMGQSYGVIRFVSPMHLLAYFCLFGFLLKVSVYAVIPDFAFFRRFVQTPGADQIGALYLSCFVLCICAGYRCAIKPVCRINSTAQARDIAAGIVRRGGLFGIAIATTILTIATLLYARGFASLSFDALSQFNASKQIHVNAQGVGATLAGIKTFFIIPKFAFVLLLAQGIVLRHVGTIVQAICLAVLIALIAVISGDRFELVEMMIFVLAIYMILGGKMRPKIVVLTLCMATTVTLISSYMTTLRGSDTGLLYQFVGSTYFLDINAAVMITDRVTPHMYLLGESYSWWSFGWVPRAFWLDKPAVDLGVFFKRDVMQITTGGAFNVTGPGEAFINFGWAGIGVGFILGWFYRKVEVALLDARNTCRHASFFYYPMLFYPFVQATLQSSFSAFIVGAAAQLVLMIAMIIIFVPRYRDVPNQTVIPYVV